MATDTLGLKGFTTGAVPDDYDPRDFGDPLAGCGDVCLPGVVDLRPWCPPIKQQGRLGRRLLASPRSHWDHG
jgi:hypothetical protein